MYLLETLRGLRRTPAFTAVAIASLALGIGANTAVFSFVNAILLKQLPVPQPERLVELPHVLKMETLQALVDRTTAFDGLFGRFGKAVNFGAGDSSQWLLAELVTGQYFKTLQIQPAIGRFLNDQDVRNAVADPVCLLSYRLWQSQLGGDPSVLNRKVSLNGHWYRVLGITPPDFHGAELQRNFDVVAPATRIGDFMPAFSGSTGIDWTKTLSWLSPMARLKPGVTKQQAQAQLNEVLRQIDSRRSDISLEDGSQGFDTMRSRFGKPVIVLMAVVGIVLLVACTNLANLLLARAHKRAKEFAIRLSLGSSRGQLIRQLLIESLVLALAGGALGILLSFWVSQTLVVFLNAGRSAAAALHISPDPRVLAFAVLLSFATATLFGLVPAWQATRPSLLPGLKEDGATGSGRLNRAVLWRLLVVLQIALSLVVVFAAGLLARTLRNLQTVDLGFQPAQVIAFNIDPVASGHSAAESSRIFDELLARARSLPDVKAASLAASTPSGASAVSLSVAVPGYTSKRPGDTVVDFNCISPQYFETLGQPRVLGRDFSGSDNANSPRVAIVNERFVQHYFAGHNPVGRKIQQGGGDLEIVGVVKNARDRDLRDGPKEELYVPEGQAQTSGLTLLVRVNQNPARVLSLLPSVVRGIDARTPVYSVHTLDVDVDAGMTSERILGYLSTLFAALATLLAGIGLYGVLAYSVARRTREIGVRVAIGAQRCDVAGLFVRETLLLVSFGVATGVPLAFASISTIRSLLFGLTPTDPPTLLASISALGLAACFATALPVWRATRVDPIQALRHE
jgi:predicted permease